MKLLAEGAEAKIYLKQIDNNKCIVKARLPKAYRITEIDGRLRKLRTRSEARIMKRVSGLISVPEIYDFSEVDFSIVMEFIDGDKLSEHLDNFSNSKRSRICCEIGKQIAILHNNNIIHGDLTTSNMILKGNTVYFIDFGLGFIDEKVEHKAVDLHLIEQALESKHYANFKSSLRVVMESYKKFSNKPMEIISRLNKVNKRGRYKNKNKHAIN